jgi:hypothetical protein
MPIVPSAFMSIAEHFIRLLNQRKHPRALIDIVRIFVCARTHARLSQAHTPLARTWMPQQRLFAICLLNVIVAGRLLDTQDFIMAPHCLPMTMVSNNFKQ